MAAIRAIVSRISGKGARMMEASWRLLDSEETHLGIQHASAL